MKAESSLHGDVATASTLEFIMSHLPPAGGRVRVLEVGCGSGALASQLQAAGFRVLAVDSSPDAVRSAVAAGVPARVAEWPTFEPDASEDGLFDAVLFTRSLHHIQPLAAALDRARDLLLPGGRVIVEDFAFADVDRRSAAWLFSILTLLDGAGVLAKPRGEFATRLLEGGGAYELWNTEHRHAITPAPVIRAALDQRFDPIVETRAPYLYRYVCPMLPADERGATLARHLYEMEWELGWEGLVRLIGRRFVGRCRRTSEPNDQRGDPR